MKKLEAHASSMVSLILGKGYDMTEPLLISIQPETCLQENGLPSPPQPSMAAAQSTLVNSATGAAGALAGWAMTSLSKKVDLSLFFGVSVYLTVN